MRQQFLIKEDHPQLLLFFTGWGMDEHPFQHLHPADCDWMICYDYRSLDFDESLLEEYNHITLIAWSMGVWVASQIKRKYPHLPVGQSIAINGTLHPIDEYRGIPPTIFEGTLQGLNERTYTKFLRRMCGSTEYHTFMKEAPDRPIEEIKEELAAIQQFCITQPPSSFIWQKAIIGKDDRIFPTENQQRAWAEQPTVTEESDAAHYQKALFNNVLTIKYKNTDHE